MKAYILFNRATPSERQMERLEKELKAAEVEVELLDADSPRGIQFAEHYDVMGRPALALIREDGTPTQVWQEEGQFPPVSEVAYLASQ
jgi:hypothetical protein